MTNLLIDKVETMLKRKLVTQRDFIWLSELLAQRLGEQVSPSTLRRLWGYSHEAVSPRKYTLDVLSRFVLYDDFDDFCRNVSDASPQSGLCLGDKVSVSDLRPGDTLAIRWMPDRYCLVRYLGEARFVIVEAENTKLAEGDTFTAHLFINHEPAFLDDLIHLGQGPLRYIAGKQSGVTVERVGE